MRLPSGRTEDRAAVAVPVYLIPLNASPLSEVAHTEEFVHTENVSPRGTRVIASKAWQMGKPALVRSAEGQFEWTGRVVYCERLPDGKFAVGLERSVHE